MGLVFRKSEFLSLGAELELQIVDSNGYALSSSSPAILERLRKFPKVKAELYQCMLEIMSCIHKDANEIADDLRRTLNMANQACDELNLSLVSAGTHPWSCYSENSMFPAKRYDDLRDKHPWIAERLLIFGLHVHIGMRSGDQAIAMSNALLQYMPLLLALSSSSPFMKGVDTKLASSRVTRFEASPVAGLPCIVDDWKQFEEMYSQLQRSQSVSTTRDLWWDLRPSPELGTLEVRICDSPATIREVSAITALIHLLCAQIDRQGGNVSTPTNWILRENKWRAARNGIRAEFIVDDGTKTLSASGMLDMILSDTSDLARKFGYNEQLNTLKMMSTLGSSADRQRAIFESCDGDLSSVVAALHRELHFDHPAWATMLLKRAKTTDEECA